MKQTFDRLVVHTPHGTSAWPLPFTFSTFDYPRLCELLDDQNDAEFETAKVNGRTGFTVHTDRGDLTAPLIVDALGWRRVLAGDGYQPPDAPLSRGLEVHPHGSGDDLELWIDRSYVPAGYGWSFPARRRAADRRRLVRPALPREGADGAAGRGPRRGRRPLPGQLDPAQDPPGGRRRHLLRRRLGRPLPAADGRGDPHRLVLRHRVRARAADASSRAAPRASRRSRATAPSATSHAWKFDWMLRAQRTVPRVPPRLLRGVVGAMGRPALSRWAFGHYLRIAPRAVRSACRARRSRSRPRSRRSERRQRPRTRSASVSSGIVQTGSSASAIAGDEVRLVVHD